MNMTIIIIGFAVLEFCIFGYLIFRANVIKKKMAAFLTNAIGNLINKPDIDNSMSFDQIIDVQLKLIKDGLVNWTTSEKKRVLERIEIKEESKHHYDSLISITGYFSIFKGIIEIFPLLGILGTVIAIGLGLGGDNTIEASEKIKKIMENFKESIWATGWGIGMASLFIILNSFLEPIIDQLFKYRDMFEEFLFSAKKEIRMLSNDGGSEQ